MSEKSTIVAGAWIREALESVVDATVVTDDTGASRTGGELLCRAEALASFLTELGLSGRTIGLWYRNSVPALEAFLAIELIGGTRLPVEPTAPWGEVRGFLDAGEAAAVLTDQACGDDVWAGRWFRHTEATPLGLFATSAGTGTALGPVTVDPDTVLSLYPRAINADGSLFAVPTSYANFAAIIDTNVRLYREGGYGRPVDGTDVLLTTVQLMHVSAMVGVFPFLALGLPQVLVSRFRPEQIIGLIAAHAVTTMFAVPRMLTKLSDRLGEFPAGHALESLRRILYGAAPVTTTDIADFRERFGPILIQLYGRYEAGWPLTVLGLDDHERLLAGDTEVDGSCGRPIAEVELELHRIGRTEVIHTRSDMSSLPFIDRDGWCNLGDTGTITERGYVRLVGRIDRMLEVNGFHVYPEEVEAVIGELTGSKVHVDVDKEPGRGDRLIATVTSLSTLTGADGNPDGLRAALRERLATYKVPHEIREETRHSQEA